MKALTALLVALLALGSVACGDSDAPTDRKEEAPSHSGTYELDAQALIDSLTQEQDSADEDVVGMSEEDKQAQKKMMEGMFGSSTGTLILKDDKTFEVDATVGGVPIKAKGSYTVVDEVLELTLVQESDEEAPFGIEKMKGSIKDGVIEVERDEQVLFPLVLRKK